MNRKTSVALVLLVATLSIAMISITDSQNAEAEKASGTYTQKYGTATKNKVCGDRLCSEPSTTTDAKPQSKTETPTTSEFKAMLDKMDSIHQKHLAEMTNQWKVSSPDMQSQIITKMKEMMTRMESMSTEDMMGSMGSTDVKKHMSETKMSEHMAKMDKIPLEPIYNEVLNPHQIDYPNILGFNDLHIHAIRHLDVNKSEGPEDHLLQTIVHHHCKVYDDMTAACLLFPHGMTDQDKPYGIEYVITSNQYNELPDDEKQYWHYHKTEFPRAHATFPELTDKELSELQPMLDETYGKVFYFWSYGDTYPIGEPYILVVQNIPDQ